MSILQPGSNYNKRRFRATGFGLDRDLSAGDKLPIWKQNMFNNIRNKSKKHRNELLKKLEQQKINAKNNNLSPNTRKKNINFTIDSFKKTIIRNEFSQQKMYNKQNIQFIKQSNNDYKLFFAELEKYLEDIELKDFRLSYLNKIDEEKQMDIECEIQQELIANNQYNNNYTVFCPICRTNVMEIEYVNNNNQRVYSCFCGLKFQPRDTNVSIPMKTNNNNGTKIENDIEHGHRMLKTLKNNLSSLYKYHCKEFHCMKPLSFAVTQSSGYLQAWCDQCKCNEIVI